jgi:hypothetical protein
VVSLSTFLSEDGNGCPPPSSRWIGVTKGFDFWTPCKKRLDSTTLDTLPFSVDNPNLTDSFLQTFGYVVFDERLKLAGRKGVEVQGIGDRDSHLWNRAVESAGIRPLYSLSFSTPQIDLLSPRRTLMKNSL